MYFLTDPLTALESLRATLGEEITGAALPSVVAALADDDLERLIGDATVLVRAGEALRIAASGVVAARSTRDSGHGGMAQVRGHRTAVSLIQELTGTTKADATKQVRIGEALLEAPITPTDNGTETGGAADEQHGEQSAARPRPWHAVLGQAFLEGRLTKDEEDAILRGLGEPPVGRQSFALDGVDRDSDAVAADDVALAAWAAAAEQLIDEAHQRTADELLKVARTIRDLLDPTGAADRFDRRFAQRSFRTWTDAEGGRHARIDFDDEMGAFVHSIIETALRPRRGGPRFVDAEEAARATELEHDDRTNDQLTYDLMMDVIRAGALADASDVFGVRQAGVGVIVTETTAALDTAGTPGVALLEDDSTAVPAWLATQHMCDTGSMECTLDRDGNPLYLGREERLFSARQKLVLAVRDGGCRWHDCDRPASYCESHHIDEYAKGGRTDVDRGILLCRYHHMALHHGGWRITRTGLGDFLLHAPPGRGKARCSRPGWLGGTRSATWLRHRNGSGPPRDQSSWPAPRGVALRAAHSIPRSITVRTWGTRRVSGSCPGVVTTTRPRPQDRVQIAGHVTGRRHGSPGSARSVVVASTSL